MFHCSAVRYGYCTHSAEYVTSSVERAFDLLYLNLDDPYTDVYISNVGALTTRDDTPISVPRLSETGLKALIMKYKQVLVNVRIGNSLLELVKQYADALEMEPHKFIEKAVDFGLEASLGNSSVTLEEWAFATHDRQHYAFRMNYKLVELIDIRANKLNTCRSVWIIWAVIAYTNKLAKKEVSL
jgi:hypothetical protein